MHTNLDVLSKRRYSLKLIYQVDVLLLGSTTLPIEHHPSKDFPNYCPIICTLHPLLLFFLTGCFIDLYQINTLGQRWSPQC